jgi:hypothetical protein
MAIRAAQLEVEVGATGVDQTQSGLRAVSSAIDNMASAPRRAASALLDFTSKMGFAVFGAQQLAGAIRGAVPALFDQNIAYENATAKIMAFTKSTDQTAQILDMVRQRAAATPFAFNEMANAAAGLIPVARTTGEQLEKLIQTSEILAASNPAEGLVGASFALKEAASPATSRQRDRALQPEPHDAESAEGGGCPGARGGADRHGGDGLRHRPS